VLTVGVGGDTTEKTLSYAKEVFEGGLETSALAAIYLVVQNGAEGDLRNGGKDFGIGFAATVVYNNDFLIGCLADSLAKVDKLFVGLIGRDYNGNALHLFTLLCWFFNRVIISQTSRFVHIFLKKRRFSSSMRKIAMCLCTNLQFSK
jgi:hypothetical protein